MDGNAAPDPFAALKAAAASMTATAPEAPAVAQPAPTPDVLEMLRSQPAPAAETAVAAVLPAPAPVVVAEAPAAAVAAPQAAPAAPAAFIVSDKPRSAPYTLLWPVMHAGKLYTSVVRSRPSSKQVGDYFEALVAQKPGDPDLRFPVFFDDAGALVPEPVWDAMDDDDQTALLTGLDDFLPLRLRRLQGTVPAASTPADGEATEPTS